MRRILLTILRLYRYLLSPHLAPACRFTPTCSQYAADAIEAHGAAKGSGLALLRVLRCRPGAAWGHDPVPPAGGAG